MEAASGAKIALSRRRCSSEELVGTFFGRELTRDGLSRRIDHGLVPRWKNPESGRLVTGRADYAPAVGRIQSRVDPIRVSVKDGDLRGACNVPKADRFIA